MDIKKLAIKKMKFLYINGDAVKMFKLVSSAIAVYSFTFIMAFFALPNTSSSIASNLAVSFLVFGLITNSIFATIYALFDKNPEIILDVHIHSNLPMILTWLAWVFPAFGIIILLLNINIYSGCASIITILMMFYMGYKIKRDIKNKKNEIAKYKKKYIESHQWEQYDIMNDLYDVPVWSTHEESITIAIFVFKQSIKKEISYLSVQLDQDDLDFYIVKTNLLNSLSMCIDLKILNYQVSTVNYYIKNLIDELGRDKLSCDKKKIKELIVQIKKQID